MASVADELPRASVSLSSPFLLATCSPSHRQREEYPPSQQLKKKRWLSSHTYLSPFLTPLYSPSTPTYSPPTVQEHLSLLNTTTSQQRHNRFKSHSLWVLNRLQVSKRIFFVPNPCRMQTGARVTQRLFIRWYELTGARLSWRHPFYLIERRFIARFRFLFD